MSQGDWIIRSPKDIASIPCQVQDRTSSSLTTTIKAGEMLKQASDGSPYVIPILDGDPENGTDIVWGIAASISDETTSADGTVDVYMLTSEHILEVKAATSTNVDTQAEIDALVGDVVSCDVTSLTQTLDENEGNDNNVHGFIILGGDPVRGTLFVRLKDHVSMTGASL